MHVEPKLTHCCRCRLHGRDQLLLVFTLIEFSRVPLLEACKHLTRAEMMRMSDECWAALAMTHEKR